MHLLSSHHKEARVKWGSCQHLLISEFDMSGMGEKEFG